MRSGKYYIAMLTAFLLVVCVWSNVSHAEESTFEIRVRKPNSDQSKIGYRYLDREKELSTKKVSVSQKKTKSKKMNKKQAALFGKKEPTAQDVKTQIGNSANSGDDDKQIQGVQRLLYVILLTDNDALKSNGKNIDYLRCRTLIQTSNNIVKLAKLRDSYSENGSKLAKLTKTGSERVSYIIKSAAKK